MQARRSKKALLPIWATCKILFSLITWLFYCRPIERWNHLRGRHHIQMHVDEIHQTQEKACTGKKLKSFFLTDANTGHCIKKTQLWEDLCHDFSKKLLKLLISILHLKQKQINGEFFWTGHFHKEPTHLPGLLSKRASCPQLTTRLPEETGSLLHAKSHNNSWNIISLCKTPWSGKGIHSF